MDPGTDDALALLLALASPELEILGVTTVAGNSTLDNTSRNARRILEYVGREAVPVYRGSSRPLARSLSTAEHVHGSDGLGETGIPSPREDAREGAVEFLANQIHENRGDITLIATGPLTNLAVLFARYPDLAAAVEDITLMGGAYFLTNYGRGNATTLSEFNIYSDPEAAAIVFNSGAPLRCVGLDVTADPRGCLVKGEIDALSGAGSLSARLAAMIARYQLDRFGHMELHDVMAMAAAIRPSMFRWVEMRVEVLTNPDISRGATVPTRPERGERPNAKICVDAEWRSFKEMFLARLTE